MIQKKIYGNPRAIIYCFQCLGRSRTVGVTGSQPDMGELAVLLNTPSSSSVQYQTWITKAKSRRGFCVAARVQTVQDFVGFSLYC